MDLTTPNNMEVSNTDLGAGLLRYTQEYVRIVGALPVDQKAERTLEPTQKLELDRLNEQYHQVRQKLARWD